MIQVNGLIVDARHLPRDIQEEARSSKASPAPRPVGLEYDNERRPGPIVAWRCRPWPHSRSPSRLYTYRGLPDVLATPRWPKLCA